MPPTLATIETNFKNYYTHKFQGKAINFCPTMGTALVFATFQQKNVKQIELSALQAIVLLAFNDQEEYTYDAL